MLMYDDVLFFKIMKKVAANKLTVTKNGQVYTVFYTPKDSMGDDLEPQELALRASDMVLVLQNLDQSYAAATAEYDRKRAILVAAMAIIK